MLKLAAHDLDCPTRVTAGVDLAPCECEPRFLFDCYGYVRGKMVDAQRRIQAPDHTAAIGVAAGLSNIAGRSR